jgi:hypothetical protein
MEAVWASDVERLLAAGQVAYGFGHPGGPMTISTDLKGPGTCDLKALVIMPERLEKQETAADLLKEIIKDDLLTPGSDILSHELRYEFLERCKRALGL